MAGRVGERPVSDQRRADERCCGVRRSRVVLTPRRWRQVRGVKSAQPGLDKNISAGDGGKRARSPGRARRKPLKPLRAGTPGDSGVLVVTRVLSTTTSAHEAAGATGIRRSPRPVRGERFINGSGASRGEVVKACQKIENRTPSFRGDAKHRTRNLEIPRCAIAHLRSGPADHPGMTESGLLRRFLAKIVILRHRVSPSASPMTGSSGVSSTLRLLDFIIDASEYWIAAFEALNISPTSS